MADMFVSWNQDEKRESRSGFFVVVQTLEMVTPWQTHRDYGRVIVEFVYQRRISCWTHMAEWAKVVYQR